MPPWGQRGLSYFPILRFKHGELLALQHLPRRDKQRLCPVVPLARVPNSRRFELTLEKLDRVVGDSGMQVIADLCDEAGALDDDNPADHQINLLATPTAGFRNWRAFIDDHENMIPVIRTPDGVTAGAIAAQARHFEALGRGLVLRLRRGRRNVFQLAAATVGALQDLSNLLVMIDFGQINGNIQVPISEAIALIRGLLQIASGRRLNVVCVASSFPFEFEGEGEVRVLPIWERELLQQVTGQPGLDVPNLNLLYGDYGSARAEERPGWRGPPRVDYATSRNWLYSRQPGDERGQGIVAAANAITDHPQWDDELQIWGSQKIREAAEGELGELGATWALPAVRINLHLHAQIFFDAPRPDFLATDDEWRD